MKSDLAQDNGRCPNIRTPSEKVNLTKQLVGVLRDLEDNQDELEHADSMNALLHRKQPSVESRNLSSERSVEVTEKRTLALLCFITASGLLSMVSAMFTTMLPLSAGWRNFWLIICLITFGLLLTGLVLLSRLLSDSR